MKCAVVYSFIVIEYCCYYDKNANRMSGASAVLHDCYCCWLLFVVRCSLHCALSLAAQCIVIGPVCVQRAGRRCVFLALWVCYHDNSKLHASIFTKLGLYVKVVTISSWLNFGRPAPREGGLRRGESFWLHLTTASAQCLRLSEHFSFFIIVFSTFIFVCTLVCCMWLCSCRPAQ